MTLLDIPRDSNIKLFFPKGAEISDGSKHVVFHHIDGMYSYCKTEKGGLIHLSALTPLKKIKGGYLVDVATK